MNNKPIRPFKLKTNSQSNHSDCSVENYNTVQSPYQQPVCMDNPNIGPCYSQDNYQYYNQDCFQNNYPSVNQLILPQVLDRILSNREDYIEYIQKDWGFLLMENVRLKELNKRPRRIGSTKDKKLINNRDSILCIYTRTDFYKDNSGNEMSEDISICKKIASFGIIDVKLFNLDPRTGIKYYIKIITSIGEVIVFDNECNPKDMYQKFIKSGHKFESDSNIKENSALIYNLVYDELNKNEKHYIEPFSTGWFNTEKGMRYLFPINSYSVIKSPIKTFEFAVTGTKEPKNSCEEVLKGYQVFSDEGSRLLMLTLLGSSLMYSLQKQSGCYINKIVVLSLGEMTNKISNLFMKVYNKNSGNTAINSKHDMINKDIYSHKDCPLVIDVDVNGLNKDYLPKKNLEYLVSVFCNGTKLDLSFEGREDFSLNAESLLILTCPNRPFITETSNHNFIILNDMCTSINMAALAEISNSRFIEQWGDMIEYFTHYVGLNPAHIKNNRNILNNTNIPDYIKVTYSVLDSVLELFKLFFSYYNVDMMKCMNINGNPNVLLLNTLIRTFSGCNITEVFNNTLIDMIEQNRIQIHTGINFPENDENLDQTLIIHKDKMLLTENCIRNIILPAMRLDISAEKLFGYLDRSNLLFKNDKFRLRTTIHIGAKSKYIGFIALKREVYKEYGEQFSCSIDNKEDDVNEDNTEEQKFFAWLELQ